MQLKEYKHVVKCLTVTHLSLNKRTKGQTVPVVEYCRTIESTCKCSESA